MGYSFPSTRKPGAIGALSGTSAIEGMPELKKILENLPANIAFNVVRTALFRGAQKIRDDAKAIAEAQGIQRSDRALIKTIRARRSRSRDRTEILAKVAAEKRYSHLIENGFVHYAGNIKERRTKAGEVTRTAKPSYNVPRHIPGRHFLVPALEQNRETIIETIQNGMKAELIKLTSKAAKGKFTEDVKSKLTSALQEEGLLP